MINRRSMLVRLAALIAAAPSIVRASFLTPIKSGKIVVNASYQSGSSLVVHALPCDLAVGDIITIANVYAVARADKQPLDRLRDFVVTAHAQKGHTVIHLYPPIIGNEDPHYQTVVKLPMNRARITKREVSLPVFG
jgi:hypothetical protein